MPTQSSSIVIGIQLNLRGSTKLEALNAAIRTLRTNISGWQKSQASANTTFGKFSTTASDAARNMKVLQSANSTLAATTDKLSRAQQNVKARYDNLTKAQRASIMQRREELRLDQLKIQMSGNLVNRLRAVETQYDAIFRAGFRLQMLGNDMEQLGRRGVEALVGIATEFGNFEFMLNRAAGAIGILRNEVDKGVNVYDAFQGAILRTATELRLFDPTEVAKATYYWASTSGQQVDTLEDLERSLKAVVPIMKVAALTETSYETAIKGAYSVLVQYGKGIDEAADVIEKLNLVSVRTAAEFPDLINSFKMVGPIAAANNVTFEEMVDLFGKLADAGIRGTMSGRAFRQLFIQLVRPTDKAKAALNELWSATEQFGGQSYMSMVFPQGSFIGPTKYIELLATATRDLTQEQRNSLLAQITTANELPVITALVNKQIYALNSQGDGWAKAGKDTRTAAQVMNDQWSLLSNSWNGLVGGFQRGVESIRIMIGGRLAGIFGPVLRDITAQLSTLTDWFDNEENGPIIEFFIKVAGAASGLLVVAGFVTKLAGALTALAAASMVALRAFGPLLAKVGVVGGVVGAFVSGVQRNFDYLKDAATSAFNDISSALGGGEDAVKGLGGAFQTFTATTRPLIDFIIRTVADLVRGFGSLVKIVAGFGPARQLVEVFGQAFIYLFATRTIANVLGLTKALGMFNGIVAKTAISGVLLNNTMKNTPGVMGKVTLAAGGIRGALGSLKSYIGPGGVFVLLAAAIGLAYEHFTPLRQAIDSVTYSLKDFKQEAQDALDSLDLYEDRLRRVMESTGEYAVLNERLVAAMAARDAATNSQEWQDGQRQIDEASARINEYRTNWVSNLNEIRESARAAGADVSDSEIFDIAYKFSKQFGPDMQNEMRAYFEAIAEGSAEGGDKLTALTNAWRKYTVLTEKGTSVSLEDWLSITMGDEGVLRARADQQVKQLMGIYQRAIKGGKGFDQADKITAGQILTQLVNLRDTGNVSDEMSKQISDLLNASVASGVEIDEGMMTEAAEKMYGEISSTLLSTGKALLDIDNQLATIMKEAIQPKRQTQAVFTSYLKGWISRGFRDTDGHFHVEAQLFAIDQIRDLGVQFQTYMGELPPAEAEAFVNKTIAQFQTDFKNGVPASVPQDMKDELWTFMQQVYASANRPIPPEVYTMIYGAGATIPEKFGEGITDPVEVTKVEDTVKGLRGKALENLDAGNVPITRGGELINGFYKGIDAGKARVLTLTMLVGSYANNLSKFTKSSWTWGNDLVGNFIRGLKNRANEVGQTAEMLAWKVYEYLHQSVADKGPLRYTDEWGGDLVDNIVNEMNKKQRDAYLAAANIATAISTGLDWQNLTSGAAIDVQSNASRLIKVQVEVTSPDGSVNKMTTAQLEDSIMTNDLLLSLEHMVTVG